MQYCDYIEPCYTETHLYGVLQNFWNWKRALKMLELYKIKTVLGKMNHDDWNKFMDKIFCDIKV